jgi:hypothetical protein
VASSPTTPTFSVRPLSVMCPPMYERLLILQPDRTVHARLGEGRVTLANLAGLLVGLAVAIVLIAAVLA